MIIEKFLKDTSARASLRYAQDALASANAYGLLMEVGARRAQAVPNNTPIEHAALRASWHEGYVECLKDICHFFERYELTAPEERKATFGGYESLFAQGEITADEYTSLTGKPAPKFADAPKPSSPSGGPG